MVDPNDDTLEKSKNSKSLADEAREIEASASDGKETVSTNSKTARESKYGPEKAEKRRGRVKTHVPNLRNTKKVSRFGKALKVGRTLNLKKKNSKLKSENIAVVLRNQGNAFFQQVFLISSKVFSEHCFIISRKKDLQF